MNTLLLGENRAGAATCRGFARMLGGRGTELQELHLGWTEIAAEVKDMV